MLDADQELLESRLTLVTAERDAYVAGFRLLQAMGAVSAQQLDLAVDYYDPAAQGDQGMRFPNLDLTPWD